MEGDRQGDRDAERQQSDRPGSDEDLGSDRHPGGDPAPPSQPAAAEQRGQVTAGDQGDEAPVAGVCPPGAEGQVVDENTAAHECRRAELADAGHRVELAGGDRGHQSTGGRRRPGGHSDLVQADGHGQRGDADRRVAAVVEGAVASEPCQRHHGAGDGKVGREPGRLGDQEQNRREEPRLRPSPAARQEVGVGPTQLGAEDPVRHGGAPRLSNVCQHHRRPPTPGDGQAPDADGCQVHSWRRRASARARRSSSGGRVVLVSPTEGL